MKKGNCDLPSQNSDLKSVKIHGNGGKATANDHRHYHDLALDRCVLVATQNHRDHSGTQEMSSFLSLEVGEGWRKICVVLWI